jgi:Spy/CpxP family protein refolding chaperone
MTEHLSLSKKQQKALKKSFIRSTKALDVIMGEADLSPLARAEKAAPILDAQKVATQEILTPEQWNKLRQLRAERCEKRGDNRRGAKKGHFRNIDNPQAFAVEHTKRMSQHLDLDAEQQTAIEAINLDLAKQLQQLKADESERKDKHAKMKAIMDANAAALKEVLNAEQYAKFEEHRQKRGERRAHMRK